jgi:hypothetical protein
MQKKVVQHVLHMLHLRQPAVPVTSTRCTQYAPLPHTPCAAVTRTSQADVADAIADVEEQLAVVLPERDERQLVLCAAYGAFDLAWQMEELLAEEPDLDLLMACVALQRVRAGAYACTLTDVCLYID